MEKGNKPTKKEVLKEIVRPVKEYCKKALDENLSLYFLPTASRKNYGVEGLNALGTAGLGFQGGIYMSLMIEDKIPAFLFPIATNVISGLYEVGRFIYKRAEQRLIDKNKSLEDKLK